MLTNLTIDSNDYAILPHGCGGRHRPCGRGEPAGRLERPVYEDEKARNLVASTRRIDFFQFKGVRADPDQETRSGPARTMAMRSPCRTMSYRAGLRSPIRSRRRRPCSRGRSRRIPPRRAFNTRTRGASRSRRSRRVPPRWSSSIRRRPVRAQPTRLLPTALLRRNWLMPRPSSCSDRTSLRRRPGQRARQPRAGSRLGRASRAMQRIRETSSTASTHSGNTNPEEISRWLTSTASTSRASSTMRSRGRCSKAP